jgi:hypothetical protein
MNMISSAHFKMNLHRVTEEQNKAEQNLGGFLPYENFQQF